MSDFVYAKYENKDCLLNMEYVMDIFPEKDGYKAETETNKTATAAHKIAI